MKDAVAARTPGNPFVVDGLIYSNNAIFGVVSKSGPMQGRMVVNGGIVAPDIGLLVPGDGKTVGLNLHYDGRAKATIQLPSDEGIILRRKLWVTSRATP